eukprot:CAMPEP_0202959540 /NCGR_PEP_ID=MMETSP1396-20130829/3716_1 /ASSEMBLY_ACC=CAM_ASM_000872 /TAXON_ID= /ORGANISM="Pseudokeronopsis sp., Strain Brazil" /LENGTH=131 /DNA_ID=CAMNT_0049678135 /DNA_START=392 /DNA_END=787 /DNA_ORIENTATION=-
MHDDDLHYFQCNSATNSFGANVCATYHDCYNNGLFYTVVNSDSDALFDDDKEATEIHNNFCCAAVEYFYTSKPENKQYSYPICIPRVYRNAFDKPYGEKDIKDITVDIMCTSFATVNLVVGAFLFLLAIVQ